MIIKKHLGGSDFRQYVGSLVAEKKVEGGMVGIFRFATHKPVIFAWLFVPTGSRGDYQNIRSDKNYPTRVEVESEFERWRKKSA